MAIIGSLEDGYDIRAVRDPFGHKDIHAMQIYTSLLNRGGIAVVSPLEEIAAR